MRMWMVDPRTMCRKHLLGEHGELHKHRHSFVKQHSVDGRVRLGQIEPASMRRRHDELAREMGRRGFKHESPYEMPDISYLPRWQRTFKVDRAASLTELHSRCAECRRAADGDDEDSV